MIPLEVLLFLPLLARGAEGDTWIKKTDMPTARQGLSACVVNGRIYAIGGVNHPGVDVEVLRTVEEYDPGTDSWATKTDMPTSRNWLACAAVNGKIYAIGGDRTFLSTPRKSVEEFDPALDAWTQKADMPTARSALATVVVDGKIYAIGGLTTFGAPPLATVEVYDPVTDTWEQKANLPTPRGASGACVVNGKVFVIGSLVPPGGPALPVVEMYDPATDTWTQKTSMPTARGGLACSVAHGRIYAMGGSNGSVVFATVEEYDPVADTWTKRADMSLTDPANSFQRQSFASSELNGRIYAVGGTLFTRAPATTLSLVLEYTPPVIPPMLQMRPVKNASQSVLRLEWLSYPDYLDVLQSQDHFQASGWTEVEQFQGTGETRSIEVPMTEAAAFYRIHRQLW